MTGGVEEVVTGAVVEEAPQVRHQLLDQFQAWESPHQLVELEASFLPIQLQLTENWETGLGFVDHTRRVLQG